MTSTVNAKRVSATTVRVVRRTIYPQPRYLFPVGRARFDFTATVPGGEPVTFTLDHLGEMAVALHLSGGQLHPDLTAEEVAALIVHGVTGHGIERVRELDRRDRNANGVMLDLAQFGDRREAAKFRNPVWSWKRQRLCVRLGMRVLRSAEDTHA